MLKLNAVCMRYYQDDQANDFVQFATDHGDQIAMKKTYCNPLPNVGDQVIIDVSPKTYTNKDGQLVAFLAYKMVRICPKT